LCCRCRRADGPHREVGLTGQKSAEVVVPAGIMRQPGRAERRVRRRNRSARAGRNDRSHPAEAGPLGEETVNPVEYCSGA
jgi:hypothetical protein